MEDQPTAALAPSTEAHYQRVAAWSLALEEAVKPAKIDEILEIAEAVDHHFAWEPYAREEDVPDPLAQAGLECLRITTDQDLDRAISKLPVFPMVAHRALRLMTGENWSAAELEAIALSDQTLASQLLAAANSWGSKGRFSTIAQAITFIGAARTSRLLYAAAIKPLYSKDSRRDLWTHSLSAAQAAEAIAEVTHAVHPKEAFLAGLVHDLGRLAMAGLPAAFQSRYAHLTGVGCEPFLVERVLSGFSHAQAGARAAEAWNFPQSLVTAVRYHHEPEKTANKIAAILYLTEHWTDSREDLPSAGRFAIALEHAGMSEAQLVALTPKDDRSITALQSA